MKPFTSWTVLPHRPIEKLTDNLWRVSGMMGQVQRQMVIGRMRDGGLMIENPIALDDAEMKELEAWGRPTYLVVPNGYHRQDAGIWKARYPHLKVVAPPRGRKRVAKIVPVDLTTDDAPGDDSVKIVPIAGCASDTLIQIRSGDELTLAFCDTILNVPKRGGAIGMMLAPTGRVSSPRAARWMMIQDKRAFAAQLGELAALPGLRRVLFGHGAPVTADPVGALHSVVEQLTDLIIAMHDELIRRLAGTADPAAIARFRDAARGLPPALVARLAAAERFRDGLEALRHIGPAARALIDDAAALAERDVLLDELTALPDDALGRAIARETAIAVAALETLRDPTSAAAIRIARAVPELVALATPHAPPVEHAPPPAGAIARPLLDHVATRALGQRLQALERRVRARFERDGLGAARLDDLEARVTRLAQAGLLPAIRVAMMHLDVCKGGDEPTRAAWRARGLELAIHNRAAAELLRSIDAARYGLAPAHAALAIALVDSHGLAGQHLRGETPRALFAPWIAYLRRIDDLAAALGVDRAIARGLAHDALHVIDVCDTAAVRDGLVDDALATALAALAGELRARADARDVTDLAAIERELADPPPPDATAARALLADRLARLRQGRQRAGESRAELDGAIAAIDDPDALALERALASCQLWYCEAATAELAPRVQLAVLAAITGAARVGGVDLARPWHAQLAPLVASLHGADAPARYRRRLVEAGLADAELAVLLARGPSGGALGALVTDLAADGEVAPIADDGGAVVVSYRDSAEAAALITLLAIYETRSSARFHATLKALCDLYDLRKDDFDRVANEAAYLAHMNAARSDKARMLDFVRPGRIVEVGPGGGVVLDLLEDRFPDAEVIGLDASAEVVAALSGRRTRDHRRWRVVHADAFALPEHLGTGTVDAIVLCSVLHEIYSYVVRPGDDGSPPRRFRLEAVRELVRACWRALAPHGRIVIRDGVTPPPGVRRIGFVAPDARELFNLYVAQFEGRPIAYRDLTDGRIELSAPDAMEFLYTYTWGPASFPYEVREQYGVLPYDAYGAALVAWCTDPATPHELPRLLPLPAELASYLQPGYRAGLAGKITLTDEHDRPDELPDSNCLLVIEKTVA